MFRKISGTGFYFDGKDSFWIIREQTPGSGVEGAGKLMRCSMSAGKKEEKERFVTFLALLLRSGLDLSSETLFFLQTTFGSAPADIADLLAGPESDEQEMVLNLVVVPDMKIRSAVEKRLVALELSDEDESWLVERLAGQVSEIPIRIPDSGSFQLEMSVPLLLLFVTKLYIGRKPDPDIYDTLLDKVENEALALEVLVEIRCRNICFDLPTKHFFISFVERLAGKSCAEKPLFDQLLTVIAARPEESTLAAYLLRLRRQALQTVREIADFQRKCDQYGMEYLMMQRYPVPFESEEEVTRRVDLLNTIINRMMIHDPAEASIGNRNLGHFSSDDGARLVRSMLRG
ncbi:MAG: hypothetical protein CSA26_06845 [Desulfobacterales bacterium]|nr:MAG: hypothetical protein CSA26_06845 [Desulfobacterales bacterium]